MDDGELNRLLREWKAPDAPPHLRARRAPWSPLRWLVAGSYSPARPGGAHRDVVGRVFGSASRGPNPCRRRNRPCLCRSGEVARYPLTGPLEGFDAVLVELNFGPGISAPEHRHPGFVLGYVVDGQMRTAVNREAGPDRAGGRHVFRTHRHPSLGIRLRKRGCGRAHPGVHGGPQRQPADRAPDGRERTIRRTE